LSTYVDSSAVLRIAFDEKNRLTEWSSVGRPITSTLLFVECLRAFDRIRNTVAASENHLRASRDRLDRLLDGIDFIEITPSIIVRAAQPFRFVIGSLDAIHLATATQWRERNDPTLTFATHDHQLALAARALGFAVLGA
jgi:predicted nucleic acid-binding protein